MMLWVVIGMIQTIFGQSATYLEYLNVPANNYLQYAQVVGPYQKELFNAGQLTIQNNFTLNTDVTNQSKINYTIFIFNYESHNYTCLMNILQYSMYVKQLDFSKCNLTVECNLENNAIQLTQKYELSQFSYCYFNYTAINQSEKSFNIQFYNNELDSNENSQFIVVILNFGNFTLSFQSNYEVIVDSKVSFYEISLGLCIGLGILVIFLISLLCILNYKYQKVKEQNITLKLVRGSTDNYKKEM